MDSDLKRKTALEKIEEQLKNGEWITQPPFGYFQLDVETVDRQRKPILIHEDNAKIVKIAFELYNTGAFSVHNLAKKLTQDYDFPCVRGNLHKMLKNPFYAGIMRVNGLEYPHRYGNIISIDLFNDVQKKITRVIKAKTIGKSDVFLYRALFKCDICGRTITQELHKKIYVYYKCTNTYMDNHPSTFIAEYYLTNAINAKINELICSEQIKELLKFGSLTTQHIILKDVFETMNISTNKQVILKISDKYINNSELSLLNLRKLISYSEKNSLLPKLSIVKSDNTAEEEKVLSLLKTALSVDDIVFKSGFSMEQIQSIIFDLQMKDLIIEQSGNYKRKK